ncbi:MAG: hypothetical protein K2I67_01780 [Malacoplasma sp.]|nr:hypothetical protein [Malacoplasma sp.]
MKIKNIIVSLDNQLVLEDYNLVSSECEILDLNKSLHDVYEDEELQKFIFDNAVDYNKIYFVCVKENFGSNEQRLENIPDVKTLSKGLKKKFKKVPNVYFFVYNTFMKNETAINPTLDIPSSINAQPAKEVEIESAEEKKEESKESQELNKEIDIFVEKIEEPKEESQEQELVEAEISVEESKEEIVPVQEVAVEAAEVIETESPAEEPQEEIVVQEETPAQEVVVEATAEESQEEKLSEDDLVDEIVSETKEEMVEVTASEEQADSDDWKEIDNFDKDEENKDDKEIYVEADEVPATTDESTIVDIVNNSSFANEITQDLATTPASDATKVENYVDPKLKDEISVPESYYDVDGSDIDVSYEDYNEFTNDYELNVHALKSLYDFIWRILVLNNYNLRLNDLLYLSVNNLEAFSIGQSDFVRQTANKADSLFDLILQLDVKLEFNNSLFYIYLAEFFSIKANKIVVNDKFLNTLSIWVDKNSKNRFVDQIQQFVNYSTVYNKKIVFSYFVELANFVKGCLPSIKPSLTLIDIHRVLINPNKKARKDNIFAFMIYKMNQIFNEQGIIIESSLVETPDNMFNEKVDAYAESEDLNWKTQLSNLYNRLIENIRNYVLLKGNNETEIFNIYIDIKDLRMYKSVKESNLLSPQTLQVLNEKNDSGYITIGDAFNRTQAIVPSQNESINSNSFANIYLNEISNPQSNKESQVYEMDNEQLKRIESLYQQNSEEINEPANIITSGLSSQSLNQTFDKQPRFSIADFEDSMSKRIEEYEKKIKANIAKIEAERKQLREKMEELRNL